MVLELYGLSRVESTVSMALSSESLGLLKGSWDLVTRVIIRVTILITPIKVLITLLSPMILKVVGLVMPERRIQVLAASGLGLPKGPREPNTP